MASIAPLAERNQRKANLPLYLGVGLLPYVFVWFLLRKEHSTQERVIGFGWFALLICIMMFANSGTDAGKRTPPVASLSVAPSPALTLASPQVAQPMAALPDVKAAGSAAGS